MFPELAACAVLLLAVAAERLHARRSRVVAALAFGPSRQPAPWARAAPWLRVAAMGGLTWGFTTLLLEPPKIRKAAEIPPGDERHLLLVLDVSPSMRLQDAGSDGKQSRMKRAAALLSSFFERTAIETYKISVVAVYTEAKPVVVATKDMDVIHNILGDLPMHYAFSPGATNLFAGLDEAIRVARPWRPGSTTLVIVSDGDTVPAVGMPKLPPAIAHVLVVGVGDPQAGKFIDGHQSRQDTTTLRQVALRLSGTYHNGNDKHLPTDVLRQITLFAERGTFEKLTRREYALIACGACAAVLAFLPLGLHLAGTRWKPGVPRTAPQAKGPQGWGEGRQGPALINGKESTMARDRIGAQIETLIQKGGWKQARAVIEKQLAKDPDDHWLWARLSGVKYELRDYQGALEAAEKALEVVADCPLALWSKAGAIEMLGKTNEAMSLYTQLFRRGLEQLKTPDKDANECWEGADWTSDLVADCTYRAAGCLAKAGQRDAAIEMYRGFLSLGDLGTQGIYSRQDALERLHKLVPNKKARREAAVKMMEKELILGV